MNKKLEHILIEISIEKRRAKKYKSPSLNP